MGPGISRTTWDALVLAFREKPGNVMAASKFAHVNRRTADKAWHHGWPKVEWAKPIKDLLDQEREEVRAARLRAEIAGQFEEDERRLKARQDAIEARAQEAHGAKLSRSNALSIAVVTAKILQACRGVAEELQRRTDASLLPQVSLEDLRKMLEVDSLGFLSVEGLYWAMGAGPRDAACPQFTDHYFTGDYPTRLIDREIAEGRNEAVERQLSFLQSA